MFGSSICKVYCKEMPEVRAKLIFLGIYLGFGHTARLPKERKMFLLDQTWCSSKAIKFPEGGPCKLVAIANASLLHQENPSGSSPGEPSGLERLNTT